ncbi:unnamed protein product [Trifolium pratense]|uniref:Uncharacterized protein n=1 Tax=Trifolium pratense TaxID=57577 RepID=A0ACB0LVP4_TRIPR|nr:unnamed protein product [Trifolium pratense]
MAKAMKFIYAIIIFISIFIIATNVHAFNECSEDDDCPKAMCFKGYVAKCINNSRCACVDEDDDLP